MTTFTQVIEVTKEYNRVAKGAFACWYDEYELNHQEYGELKCRGRNDETDNLDVTSVEEAFTELSSYPIEKLSVLDKLFKFDSMGFESIKKLLGIFNVHKINGEPQVQAYDIDWVIKVFRRFDAAGALELTPWRALDALYEIVVCGVEPLDYLDMYRSFYRDDVVDTLKAMVRIITEEDEIAQATKAAKEFLGIYD